MARRNGPFRSFPLWTRVLIAVLGFWALSAVVSAITPKRASSAAGGILLLGLVVLIFVLIRRGNTGSGTGLRHWPRRRSGHQLLTLRWNSGALFPHGVLGVTPDAIRDPWHQLLESSHRKGQSILFIPCKDSWVSEYATESRVISVQPLYQFEGIRRVRILKTEPVSMTGRQSRLWFLRPFVGSVQMGRLTNPLVPTNVFVAEFMPLADEIDAEKAIPLVRSVRKSFVRFCEQQPNGKELAKSLAEESDPGVVAGRVGQALFGASPSEAAQLLAANDVNYRLKVCSDLLRIVLTPSPDPNGAADVKFQVQPSDSLPTFADVGGMGPLKTRIQEAVGLVLENLHAAETLKLTINGILLYGPPGTGKTLFARATAGQYQLNFMNVSGSDISGSLMGESEQRLRSAFTLAVENSPCLLFLDELDSLAGKRGEGGGAEEHQRRLVTQLLRSLEEVRLGRDVIVMAATNDIDSLDPAVVRSGRFDYRIRVDLPDEAARQSILEAALRDVPHDAEIRLADIVAQTGSRTGSDLVAIVEGAKLLAMKRSRSNPKLSSDDLQMSLQSRRGGDAPTLKLITWDELILPDDTKAQLQQLAQLIADPRRAIEAGLNPPRGALLYGPPGTGKTTIALAIATQLKGAVSFLPVKGSDIRSKWVGDSAKHVRDLFARAQASSPTIIFIDEIETLLSRRGEADDGNANVDEQVVTEFLQHIDGIDSTPGIFVLGATNFRDKLDPAVTRGGRLGRQIEIPLPNAAGRETLFRLHSKSLHVASDVDFEVVARMTERFSGADIESLCQEAAARSFDRESGPREVTFDDFVLILKRRRAAPHFEKKGWDDLILSSRTVRELQNLAELIGNPEAAREFGIKVPAGALLWGPPGTGKSTIARVFASELTGRVAFLSAKGSDLRSKWVGGGEKNLRDLFDRARSQVPAIIFIDEIDALAPRRGLGGEAGNQSLLTEFLQQLDGIDSTPGVFVLGATNVPDQLDPAITRGGRLGRKIEIPLPTLENREALLRLYSHRMKLDPGVDPCRVAMRIEMASGADIEAICSAAGELAFHREQGPRAVTDGDFLAAVENWQSSAWR